MSLRLSLMGSSASGLSGSSSRLEATEWLEAASDMASKLSDVLPMLPSSWLRLKRVLFSPVGPRMEFSSELTVAFPWLFRRIELPVPPSVPWIKMERLIKCQWSSLGWAPWNLSCLEFKFDDTRVLLSQPKGQKISNVRKQQFFFQFCQSYSYVNRKVWYHQIWIPNNLGFMVLILTYILTSSTFLLRIMFMQLRFNEILMLKMNKNWRLLKLCKH